MTIDGKDILATYGCVLQEGSYGSLLKYPKRKNVVYNDWAETDGIEPDLDTVEFEPKKIRLSFLQSASSVSEFRNVYNKLITDLSAPGYRQMDFFPGMVCRLRLNLNADYAIPVPFNAGKVHTSFTLEFVEDNPVWETVSSTTGGNSLYDDYAINGLDFAYFGIAAETAQAEILKYPGVKTPFTEGLFPDLRDLKMTHKEIKLSLSMVAPTQNEFLNNYRAFFYHLTRPGTQELYARSLEGMVSVYYADCSSFSVEKWGTDGVGARFSVTLVVPVVRWVDGGGNILMRVMLDDNLGVLTDEDGRILELK